MVKTKQSLKAVNAPVFSYWQALYMAFYSPKLYLDVGKRWRGFGFFYLLLLIMLVSIPIATKSILSFNAYFNDQFIFPMEKLPPLYIQNGKVQVEDTMPYKIMNRYNQIVLIVDTSGKTVIDSPQYPDLSILITSDKIYFKDPKLKMFEGLPDPTVAVEPAKVTVQDIPAGLNQVFIGKDWVDEGWMSKLKLIADLMIYPLIVLIFFTIYMVFLPILALIGQVFTEVFFKFKLKFNQSTRLMIVAATAQALLFSIFTTTNILSNFGGFIYLLITLLYYYFAVLTLSKDSKKMVHR